MTVRDAPAVFAAEPELNRQLLDDYDSWAGRRVATLTGMVRPDCGR